jgi:hypothetical protein
MRERRTYPRYDVSTHPDLVGRTNKSPVGEKLMTLSLSGCGFSSLLDDFRFKVGDIVEVELKWINDEWVKVQGAILYSNPFPYDGQIGRYYGVRFLGEYENIVRPMVDILEAQHIDGKVSKAQ